MNKKAKLVIIGATPPPYHGVTISTERLINSKLKDVYNLIHFDISDKRNISNIGRLDFWNIYLALKQIFKLIFLHLKEKPDMVYLTIAQNGLAYLRDGLFILVTKLFSKAKVIIHLRGCYFKTFYKNTNVAMKRFIDLTMGYIDRVIVLGNSLKYIFELWFSNDKIDVVPNGTPMNPDVSDKFHRNKSEIQLAFLGNLFREKGIVETVEAMKYIREQDGRVRLKIAGEWRKQDKDIKSGCLNMTERNNLENCVEFCGVITEENKEKFLLDTDIFIFPSFYEGHPNVIIEAMAAGCPIISTDTGAIPETVINGVNGFIIEKGNSKAIAGAITKLIVNKELIQRMGKESRRRYEQYYTQEKNIENMIRVFNRCLKD